MKKVFALLLAVVFVLGQGVAFAADYVPNITAGTTAQVIPVSVNFGGTLTFAVTLLDVDDHTTVTNEINFDTSAPQIVKGDSCAQIQFDAYVEGDQSVIIYTDNSDVYGGTFLCNGAVGTSDNTKVVPFKWAVYNSPQPGGSSLTYECMVECGYVQDLVNTTDPLENQYDYDAGYGTVISGVVGTLGSLAAFPPASFGNRSVDNGYAYLYLAVDYTGANWDNYVTDSLTLAMITAS